MMHGVHLAPHAPALRQDLVITPRQIKPRMDLDEQIDEQRDEERPRQHMAADDVQREIRQHDERQAFCDRQAIRDLRVDLCVGVVGMVDAGQGSDAMDGEMEKEEESVVDDD